MATRPAEARTKEAHQTVFVDTFTDGLLGPDVAMLGPVADGGHVVWNSAPGCWGPMITPSIRGGHEVAQPVAVAGADVGDGIAVRIKAIEVTSLATASGTDLSGVTPGSFSSQCVNAAMRDAQRPAAVVARPPEPRLSPRP